MLVAVAVPVFASLASVRPGFLARSVFVLALVLTWLLGRGVRLFGAVHCRAGLGGGGRRFGLATAAENQGGEAEREKCRPLRWKYVE